MSSSLPRKHLKMIKTIDVGHRDSYKGDDGVKNFIKLVGRLQLHYQCHLSSCLVAMNKFTKSLKYFCQALRSIKPSDCKVITSLRIVEAGLASCQSEHGTDNSWFLTLESFLLNVKNFRLLRQQVKMDIYNKLKKLPKELESPSMRRSRGELEVLLNTWSTLVNVDNDLSKLEHASVAEYSVYFQSEHEMNAFKGVLSLLPKLSDIVNRIDFLLTKYQM